MVISLYEFAIGRGPNLAVNNRKVMLRTSSARPDQRTRGGGRLLPIRVGNQQHLSPRRPPKESAAYLLSTGLSELARSLPATYPTGVPAR